jgi:hypothetical protein
MASHYVAYDHYTWLCVVASGACDARREGSAAAAKVARGVRFTPGTLSLPFRNTALEFAPKCGAQAHSGSS